MSVHTSIWVVTSEVNNPGTFNASTCMSNQWKKVEGTPLTMFIFVAITKETSGTKQLVFLMFIHMSKRMDSILDSASLGCTVLLVLSTTNRRYSVFLSNSQCT